MALALLEMNVDTNAKNKNGATPLYCAVYTGNHDILKALIKHGADTGIKAPFNNTPSTTVIRRNDLEALKIMIEAGLDPKFNDGAQDLFSHAVTHSKPEIIKYLASKGACTPENSSLEAINRRLCNQYNVTPETMQALIDITGKEIVNYTGEYSGESLIFFAVRKNNIELCKILLKNGADINAKSSDSKYKQTALHIATSEGKLEMCRFLMENGADVNTLDKFGNTATLNAWNYPEIIKLLVQHGFNLNRKDRHGNPLIFDFMYSPDIEILKLFFAQGVEINIRNDYNGTLLHAAALSSGKKSLEVMKYLVEEAKLDVNAKTKDQCTPLCYAAVSSSVEKVKYLVEHGAEVNPEGSLYSPLAHVRNQKNQFEITEYLLEKGADPNKKEYSKPLPVILALNYDNDKMLDSLIKAGADCNISYDNMPLMAYAITKGKTKCAKILANMPGRKALDKETADKMLAAVNYHEITPAEMKNIIDATGTDVKTYHGGNGYPLLYRAVSGNNLKLCEFLIQKGADVNETIKYESYNVFHAALMRGDIKIVKLFLAHGADVNITDSKGRNSLFFNGLRNTEIMNMLLEKGADIKCVDKDGWNLALHAAAKHDMALLKKAIEKGVDPKSVTKEGRTLLHLASYDREILVYLVEKLKLDVNARDNGGATPVCQIKYSDPAAFESMKYLVKHGAFLRDPEKRMNPLNSAATHATPEILKYMLEKGADPNLPENESAQTPLSLAICAGKIQNAKILIAAGADTEKAKEKIKPYIELLTVFRIKTAEEFNFYISILGKDLLKTEYGTTWLMNAIEQQNTEIVKCLIQSGCDVNANKSGTPPLIKAVSYGKTEIVKMLIDAKADVNISLNMYETPLINAARSGKIEIVKMLLDAKADVNRSPLNGTKTPLIDSAAYPEITKLLLEKGADQTPKNGNESWLTAALAKTMFDDFMEINSKYQIDFSVEKNNTSLLFAAAENRDALKFIKFLVEEKGIPVETKKNVNNVEYSLLDYAYATRRTNLYHYLTEKGLKAQYGNKVNSLACAIYGRNDTKIIEKLMDDGADLNEEDAQYGTPLQAAIHADNKELFSLLIEKGAKTAEAMETAIRTGKTNFVEELLKNNIQLPEKIDDTPILFYAIRLNNIKMFRILKDACGSFDPEMTYESNTILTSAVASGDVEFVRIVIEAGVDVNKKAADGSTPLIRSILRCNHEMTKLLIDAGADVNAKDEYGQTAISYTDNQETVKLLVDAGADLTLKDDRGNYVGIRTAIRTPEALKKLEEAGLDVKTYTQSDGTTLLIPAIERNCIDTLKYLISKGVDVNKRGMNSQTPLECAIRYIKPEITDILLDAGANPDDGEALAEAVSLSDIKFVKKLLERGANPDTPDRNGLVPLANMSQINEEILKYMIEKGADINLVPPYKINTTLSNLVLCDKYGYDFNNTDGNGRTLLHYIANYHDKIAQQLVIRKNRNANQADNDAVTPLMLACSNLNTTLVELLLEKGADANLRDANGQTALLHLAKTYRNDAEAEKKILALLIKNNANINVKDNNDFDALTNALNMERANMVEILVKSGIKPSADQQKQILKLAARRERMFLAGLLVDGESGSLDINLKSDAMFMAELLSNGDTEGIKNLTTRIPEIITLMKADPAGTLLKAIRTGSFEKTRYIMELLQTKPAMEHVSAAVQSQNYDLFELTAEKADIPLAYTGKNKENTLLHYAAGHRDPKILKYILEHGGANDIERQNGNGDRPVDCAIQAASIECLKLLAKHGATIKDPPDEDKSMPRIISAVISQNLEIIKLLQKKGCDIFATDSAGKSLLYYAVNSSRFGYDSTAIVKYLLECGLNPCERFKDGTTLFHTAASAQIFQLLAEAPNMNMKLDEFLPYAAKNGCYDIVKYLLTLNVDADYTDKDGNTAYDYIPKANNEPYNAMRRLLLEKMKTKPDENKKIEQTDRNGMILIP